MRQGFESFLPSFELSGPTVGRVERVATRHQLENPLPHLFIFLSNNNLISLNFRWRRISYLHNEHVNLSRISSLSSVVSSRPYRNCPGDALLFPRWHRRRRLYALRSKKQHKLLLRTIPERALPLQRDVLPPVRKHPAQAVLH